MSRTHYLVAYDIRDQRRLARTGRSLKAFRVQGQKSVPEIWVTPAELQQVCQMLSTLIDPAADSVFLLALDPRMKPRCMGLAQTFNAGAPRFFIT
jgi:CRISPR-associated protein Cas2